jgi:hypothetical protein
VLADVPVIGRVPLAAEVGRVEREELRVESGENSQSEFTSPQATNGHAAAETEERTARREASRVFDEIAAVLREQLK